MQVQGAVVLLQASTHVNGVGALEYQDNDE